MLKLESIPEIVHTPKERMVHETHVQNQCTVYWSRPAITEWTVSVPALSPCP